MAEVIVRPVNEKTATHLRTKLQAYMDALNTVLVTLDLDGEWSFNTAGGYLQQTIAEVKPATSSEGTGPAGDGVAKDAV